MRPVRILVAALDRTVTTELQQSLTRLGHTVAATATSLADALSLAAEQRPDLLVLDVGLLAPTTAEPAGPEPLSGLPAPVVCLAPRTAEAVHRALGAEPFGLALLPIDDEQLAAILETALTRHHAEQTLRRHGTQLAETLDRLPEAALITDPRGQVSFLNPAAEALIGWIRQEAQGRPLTEVARLLDEDSRQPVDGKEQGSSPSAVLLVARDGRELPVQVLAAPLREGGTPAGTILILRDLTEARRVEEQARQVRALEAVGQLAGGVAHDFNNLLTVINGYSSLLVTAVGPDHPWHGFLDEIHKAGERCAELTRQLLAFSRKQLLQPRACHLNEIVARLADMLRRLLGPAIELVTALSPSVPPITADPGQLEQVLVNLATNARDACPQGGRLTVETARIVLTEPDTRSRPGLQPGPCVRLTVTDTGHGMPESIRGRIFEPFFTTKPLGQGTGMGLASVYGIIKQSNGHIEVASREGHGTSFTIYLPPAAEPVNPAPNLPLAELPHGSETVLLVEDEQGVRDLNRQVLRLCGYTVLEARHGAEALKISAQYSEAIHLLVTDAVLPQMSGRELSERLAGQRPGMRVLFLSGYTNSELLRHEVPNTGFLLKPYSPRDLAHKVRQLLD
ncbi:MAG: response regulator [Gemmataceae bacterium]|nr:response regulator [Gemmataceae bacterium]